MGPFVGRSQIVGAGGLEVEPVAEVAYGFVEHDDYRRSKRVAAGRGRRGGAKDHDLGAGSYRCSGSGAVAGNYFGVAVDSDCRGRALAARVDGKGRAADRGYHPASNVRAELGAVVLALLARGRAYAIVVVVIVVILVLAEL